MGNSENKDVVSKKDEMILIFKETFRRIKWQDHGSL